MIDFSDITPMCDVSIGVSSGTHDISIWFTKGREKECEEIYKQFNSTSIKAFKNSPLHLSVDPVNFDRYQIAERIASSLESQSLKVRRMVTPPENQGIARDKSATKEIQSFILA